MILEALDIVAVREWEDRGGFFLQCWVNVGFMTVLFCKLTLKDTRTAGETPKWCAVQTSHRNLKDALNDLRFAGCLGEWLKAWATPVRAPAIEVISDAHARIRSSGGGWTGRILNFIRLLGSVQ